MNAIVRTLALGALVLGLSTGAASAIPITYNYDINGIFKDPYNGAVPAGTLSGTFSVQGTLNPGNIFTTYTITAANLNVSNYTDLEGHPFSNFTYSLINSTVTGAGPSQYFQFDTLTGEELRIYLTGGALALTGAIINAPFSYDHQPLGGNRTLSSGSITQQVAAPVPEPSSIALLGAGLALLGAGFAVRRTRKPVAAIA